MSLRGLEIAIVEAMVGVRRNFLMSIASIMTAALTLGILGGFVLLALGMSNFLHSQVGEFEAAVWLNKGTTKATAQKLHDRMKKMPNVASVQFVSSNDAWKKIKHDLGKEIELDGASPEQLSDHFVLKVDDLRRMSGVVKSIRTMKGVEAVIEAQDAVKWIIGLSDLIKWIGCGVALVLLLVTTFIVSNTIRLTVYARKREIKIMQLVGATNWFIRLPLLLEGTLLGTLGGGIACLLILGCSTYLAAWVGHYLQMPFLGQFTSDIDPVWFYSSLVGLGWVIGAMGTVLSIQKFLKA